MSSEPKPVILYIDDDPDYREVMRAILEGAGYEMIEAASGEEGLAAYRSRKPDLVIVDLMMEEVDTGAGFAKELRLLGNTAPIYMLSSVGDSLSLAADNAALGFAGIFQKPIDRAALLAILKRRLGR
jgi:two-component system nitrogen regulation response regulator NtrX